MNALLITGASGGIGKAVAKKAAASGWDVWLAYNSHAERAEQTASEINSSGGHASCVFLPLHDATALDAALQKMTSENVTLKGLVLCAALAPSLLSFLKTSEDDLARHFEVNVEGHRRLVVEVWKKHFRLNQGGHIVALLSAAIGRPPWPHMTSYVVAKRALEALLECAAAELGPAGLRVSFVSPDYTETPMLMQLEPRILEAARAKKPHGTFLKPEVVAKAVMACLETSASDPVPRTVTVTDEGVRS